MNDKQKQLIQRWAIIITAIAAVIVFLAVKSETQTGTSLIFTNVGAGDTIVVNGRAIVDASGKKHFVLRVPGKDGNKEGRLTLDQTNVTGEYNYFLALETPVEGEIYAAEGSSFAVRLVAVDNATISATKTISLGNAFFTTAITLILSFLGWGLVVAFILDFYR